MVMTAQVERGVCGQSLNPTLDEVALSSSGTGSPEEWGASSQNDVPGLVRCGFPPSIELRAAHNARPKLTPASYSYK